MIHSTINDSFLTKLNDYYIEKVKSTAVFVTGEKGVGKTTIIQQFCSKQSNAISVKDSNQNVFYLQPVINALNLYYGRINQSSDFFPDLDSGFSVEEMVTEKILEIAQKAPLIVVFESINGYGISLLLYIRTLLNTFLIHNLDSKAFIIVEIDTDGDVQDLNATQILTSLYSLVPDIQFVALQRLSEEQLESYFFSVFNDNIQISPTDLNYIIQSAFGNIMYMNIIINYLRQTNLIFELDGKMMCKILHKGVLGEVLKQYILSRYNKLDSDLRHILSRSSIIGRVFDKRLLYSQFQILQADEQLQRIEQLSKLIHEEDQYQYTFENDEVYRLVQNNISDQEKIEWHSLLAEYYETKVNLISMPENQISEAYIKQIFGVAYHYEQCFNQEKAIPYYMKLISIYITLMDYRKAIEIIDKTEGLLVILNLSYSEVMHKELLIESANCHRLLGDYDEAVTLYHKAIDCSDFLLDLHTILAAKLNLAYCLHMKGKLMEALHLALEIKEELSDAQETRIYFQVLDFLSSVNDLLGKCSESQLYFNWSLKYSLDHGLEHEYYSQLKKASMVFDLQVSQPMMHEAARFFEKKKNIRELAETKHNLATDSLYLADKQLTEKYLAESIELYKRYNSSAIHYPLNTKAILLSVFEHNHQAAFDTLKEALSYLENKTELFSQITLHINLAFILLQIGQFEKSKKQIETAELLIYTPEGQLIPFCRTYLHFGWAIYFLRIQQFQDAISHLHLCLDSPDLPPKHQYLAAKFLLKMDPVSASDKTINECAKIVCEPLIYQFERQNIFFGTLRCWE